MPKAESEINEIKKYFVTWISEVALANALNFYDINRISEGTCAKLLNLVFDYQLQDLNKVKPNYPGIDLGDKPNGLAFQVTSRMDAAKIIHSLKSFADNGYGKDFPKGIRFFIINSGKRPAVKAARLTGYEQIFDLKSDVYFPADVIRLIEGIYYADAAKFAVIKEFLQAEFSNHPAKKTIIQLIDSAGKLDFYKKLFIANNERTAKRFVPFSCKAGDANITTEQLVDVMFAGKGATITGPSGCGKSILARKLALAFLQQGIPVLLEAKYYEGSLNTLFEKEVVAYGFATGAEYFAICKEHQLKSLLVIDGLNECKATHSPKFLLELENVMNNYPVTVIITTQVIDEEIGSLGLARVDVGYPEQATKKAIAASYSGKKLSPKLDPILQMVSSSMEAKMIGEIGSEEVDPVSRFTLFEIFISGKLGDYKSNGFLLLAAVAAVLSEKITFSLSERTVEGLLRSNKLTDEVYRRCQSSRLVEQRLGQVSFTHEMFFNFFVADSIVRFAKDTDELLPR